MPAGDDDWQQTERRRRRMMETIASAREQPSCVGEKMILAGDVSQPTTHKQQQGVNAQ